MNKNVHVVGDADWNVEVLQSEELVLVDFWAEWCPPCRKLSPVIDALADEYAGRVKVVKLNVDESPEVAGRYSIFSIPTLLLVGQFDPFGVSALVREAARSLDTSWVVEFPLSHNVLGYEDECPREIRNAWVDAQTSAPDTSCVETIPPVFFPIP